MIDNNQWFEIIKHKDYLIVIREKLDDIDPRFYSDYTNLYLLLGIYSALLIDTGAGLFPLKPIIDELIGERKLHVYNTHAHWDHICGNHEFGEVSVHEIESKMVSNPTNITNLMTSPKEIVKAYESKEFVIPPAKIVNSLQEGDVLDLGALTIKAIHTPGHSPGSLSFLTNKGELFVGDLAHYGSVYLPKKKQFHIVLSSLEKLMALLEEEPDIEIYPGHEKFPVGIELLQELHEGINNIENSWETKKKDSFLRSWIIKDDRYNFKYIISKI